MRTVTGAELRSVLHQRMLPQLHLGDTDDFDAAPEGLPDED